MRKSEHFLPFLFLWFHAWSNPYQIKAQDRFREIRVSGGIPDVLAPYNGPPTLYLHIGGDDREVLELLHVPDTPAQYL